MTNNTESFPSAADALGNAIRYVQDMTNGMTATERAKLWFDIAVELRTDAQWRAVRERVTRVKERAWADVTAVIPLPDIATTQAVPVVPGYSFGDKADCRHCHTPIEYVEVTIPQQTYGQGFEGMRWRHKYSQQAVCAEPYIGGENVEPIGPRHTFAEPEPRG